MECNRIDSVQVDIVQLNEFACSPVENFDLAIAQRNGNKWTVWMPCHIISYGIYSTWINKVIQILLKKFIFALPCTLPRSANVWTQSPPFTSNSFSVRSSEQDAIVLPLGEYRAQLTRFVWPKNDCKNRFVSMLHNLTALSSFAVTNFLSFGWNSTLRTQDNAENVQDVPRIVGTQTCSCQNWPKKNWEIMRFWSSKHFY